jgi:hypothetical protein
VEAGSVYPRLEAKDPKERSKQSAALPSTLKEPLKEGLQTSNPGQMNENEQERKLCPVSRFLPDELRVNVRKYLSRRRELVYTDSWLTLKYYCAPDNDEGLIGVYTERGGKVSQVTLEVQRGKLTHVFVNCSKALLSRMLKNGLPKEMKDAMRYAREIM